MTKWDNTKKLFLIFLPYFYIVNKLIFKKTNKLISLEIPIQNSIPNLLN